VSATDHAGNRATQTVTYTVVAAPPTIQIVAPIANHPYDVGEVVPVKYRCTDGAGGPGIKSCRGTVRRGRLLNTQSPGTFTFKVTAKSRDGQKTTKTVSYSTVVPVNHPVFELRLHGTLFVNTATSAGGPSDHSTIAMLEGCAEQQNRRNPQCGQEAGSLKLKAAFPKAAPFTKAKHPNLFDKGGQGTLYLYVRGSTGATQTYTWSVTGMVIVSIQIAPAGNGVLTETITLNYKGFKLQQP
jgi:hypothetical protein